MDNNNRFKDLNNNNKASRIRCFSKFLLLWFNNHSNNQNHSFQFNKYSLRDHIFRLSHKDNHNHNNLFKSCPSKGSNNHPHKRKKLIRSNKSYQSLRNFQWYNKDKCSAQSCSTWSNLYVHRRTHQRLQVCWLTSSRRQSRHWLKSLRTRSFWRKKWSSEK